MRKWTGVSVSIKKSILLANPNFYPTPAFKYTHTHGRRFHCIFLEDSDVICFWKGFWKKKNGFPKNVSTFLLHLSFLTDSERLRWGAGKEKWNTLGWMVGTKLRVTSETYQKMHICGLCSQPFKPLGNGHSWWEEQKFWFSIGSAFRHTFIHFVEKVALSFFQWTLLATHWIMKALSCFLKSHFWRKSVLDMNSWLGRIISHSYFLRKP